MEVKLLSFTPDALNLLLRTKNTRLNFKTDPAKWTDEQRREHLEYMRDTIKSSWEFVDYTFEITGVTRAFTHQLVRTRTGHYAQEAQRVVNAADHGVDIPPAILGNPVALTLFEAATRLAVNTYERLADAGVPRQDARGVLPTNIKTSITCKFDLRTLSEMAKVRLCTRTQGEYQSVFREMRRLIIEQHPWAADFIDVQCVATGTCAFPRYGKKDCQHWDDRMDHTQFKKEQAVRFWSAEMQEANPILKDGRTM